MAKELIIPGDGRGDKTAEGMIRPEGSSLTIATMIDAGSSQDDIIKSCRKDLGLSLEEARVLTGNQCNRVEK